MRLSLLTVEKCNANWYVGIIDIDTSNWYGSLLSIDRWNGTYQFDLFWLRSLYYWYINIVKKMDKE